MLICRLLHQKSSISFDVGMIFVIVCALYGGKSAGTDYLRHVRSAMTEMGFDSCKAGPDVWFQPATISDGTKYYQYVLYPHDNGRAREVPQG